MKIIRWVYPSLVGLLLGLLQTGLFLQLTFTLSSSFQTYLMITVCWLLGSVIGIRIAKRVNTSLNAFVLVTLSAYFGCVPLLRAAPFDTQRWPIYATLIVLTGIYPGVFFARLGEFYTARSLFLRENNGFIVGLVTGSLMFMAFGRASLWIAPLLAAGVVIFCTAMVNWTETDHADVEEAVTSA
jgi:hypothetical protein